MQISGIAVRLKPEQTDAIKEQFQAIRDLEIHAEGHGKLGVTLENRTPGEMTDTIQEIEGIEGIIAVNPVYIYDDSEMAEAS